MSINVTYNNYIWLLWMNTWFSIDFPFNLFRFAVSTIPQIEVAIKYIKTSWLAWYFTFSIVVISLRSSSTFVSFSPYKSISSSISFSKEFFSCSTKTSIASLFSGPLSLSIDLSSNVRLLYFSLASWTAIFSTLFVSFQQLVS